MFEYIKAMEGEIMNKQCRACGSNVPSEARFCQMCGSTDFISSNQQQSMSNSNSGDINQPIYNQNQFTQQNSFNQAGWQSPVPQNQPKKKNTGLIIGIVAAVLTVLAGIGFVAEKAFQNQGYGSTGEYGSDEDYDFDIGGTDDFSTDSDSYDEPDEIEYTKGTFDGTVYINEWADIKLALPEGFSNADSTTYATAESANTDCGVYFMSDDTMSLVYICYEELPTIPAYDEESYLDVVMDNLEAQTQITYQTTDIYTTTSIGGYAYASAECKFNNGYGDFVQNIYVRKIDNRMIFIAAIGVSADANQNLINMITKAN